MAVSRTRTAVVLLGLLLTATCPSVALADVAGPDESVSQAYGPLQSGSAHSGAFASANDVDYLSVVVATAGQTLNFGVQNTTQVCNDPYAAGCPVYATLMDSSGMNQLGGDGSGAGTIATSGDTETFSWTFTQPGTYYLLMESDGDLSPGSPSYAVSLTSTNAPASSGSSGGSGAPAGSGRRPESPLLAGRRGPRRRSCANCTYSLASEAELWRQSWCSANLLHSCGQSSSFPIDTAGRPRSPTGLCAVFPRVPAGWRSAFRTHTGADWSAGGNCHSY